MADNSKVSYRILKEEGDYGIEQILWKEIHRVLLHWSGKVYESFQSSTRNRAMGESESNEGRPATHQMADPAGEKMIYTAPYDFEMFFFRWPNTF